ncbi:MAG: hypothetical protein KDE08_11955 [Rhodobacteraceae bacterium]|nr:hypothetical protein [Paracoccaceae bacterium]
MPQSRSLSALEAGANLVVGYLLAVAVQLMIFPVMGLAVTPLQSAKIGGAFTVVSFARSYVLRRLFEQLRRGDRS